jgi:2-polyprenylphenol 6-hydroxylase
MRLMGKRGHFDVVIVGGGLVGAAFAAAVGKAALDIALIETRAPRAPVPPNPDWDARVYAISPASRQFLAALGAWDALDPGRLTAIHRMQIFGDDGAANIVFDAFAAGVPELAWIVEDDALQTALWGLLGQQKNLRVFCPAQCAALNCDAGANALVLEDGTRVTADLIVGADGAQSWLRNAAGLVAAEKPYAQQGIVANFSTERPHRGTAYQWFRPEGTLAYLPLPGQRVSIVWSAADDYARELMALAPGELANRVAAAAGHTLGALESITPARAFPLRLLTVGSSVAPGLALIGDAAHVVHPLAGQGLNLGFADAYALVAALTAREPFRSCGDSRLLRRYERNRREHHVALQWVTDGLQRMFSSDSSVMRQLRNRGLELTDALPVVKNLLTRQALGSF